MNSFTYHVLLGILYIYKHKQWEGVIRMKIEKINDNQIRCTLTRADLATHEIKFSELTYGTEKARTLFRNMMQQANYEVGFEVDNTPLMIEAIPLHSDGIVLIITKVEDPDELDTRFSKFAPDGENYQESAPQTPITGADDVIDLFQKLVEAKRKSRNEQSVGNVIDHSVKPEKDKTPHHEPNVKLLRLFSFKKLDDVVGAAHALDNFFIGNNSLYKTSAGAYELVLHKSGYTPEAFNKVCNMLSEYGQGKAFSVAGEAHLKEHGKAIINDTALQTLATL